MSQIELLTLPEVATIFKCSPVTIRRRVCQSREGKSRFPLPIGAKCQHLRFSQGAILDFLKHGESEPVTSSSTKPEPVAALTRHGIVRKGGKVC
jgi:hypothetical protein